MATVVSSPSAPTSRLAEARKKYSNVKRIAQLRSQNYIEQEDIERIPSIIPSNDEELTAFMQQLFQYGIKKWMPGCPVRVNRNILSVRLDGIIFRRAQEIRGLFEKNGIRTYINEKNNELYRQIEQNVAQVLRGNGYTEFVQEEGRDFYHIPATPQSVGNGLPTIYQTIVQQGRHDRLLNEHYEAFIGLVKERNDERRREFILNRTQLNSEYIQHVVNTLTIPLEHLDNPALVQALQEAGLVAFIKQPKLNELVSTEIMVDVYSAPNEEDETWRIMPVTPEIVESTDARIYHGQGTITAYDPASQAAKNGTLPFVIQHCLRAGADIADFIAILPEEFKANLGKANEIYFQFTGDSSENLDKAALASNYQRLQREGAQQSAQEAILAAPTVSALVEEAKAPKGKAKTKVVRATQSETVGREELDRLVREAFAQPVPEAEAVQQAQSSVVDSLTQSLLAQLQEVGVQPPDIAQIEADNAADDDDDLPFEEEPAVEQVEEVPEEPVRESLSESLMRQLRERQTQGQQARTEAEAPSSYHHSYGTNPIFLDGSNYISFRGQEGRVFNDFNAAAIYAGKAIGAYAVYEYINRHRAAVGTDTIYARQFDGRLL